MLKVVGASFGRTGTTSVRLALEKLGFGPCHYMHELAVDHRHASDWLRMARDNVDPDWESLLGRFSATIAWPAAAYWRELAAAYPAAKVLLIVRDPESWYDSVARTLYRTRPTVATTERDRVVEEIIWRGTFSGRFNDRDHAIDVYLRHLADVRATTPADRLVEVDPAGGWEPLCVGLGAAVPAEAFPIANTTDEYLRRAADAGVIERTQA